MLLNKNTIKVTFCGVVTSLCVTIMFFANILPTFSFALPAMASTIIMSVVVESGKKWAMCVYFCVSIISLMLVADKEAVFVFIIFFGYYPILKAIIEKVKYKFIQMIVKLILFNFIAVLEFFVSVKILLIPQESFSLFGVSSEKILLIFVNTTFLIYDLSLSMFLIYYLTKIRPKINNFIKSK